MPKKRLVDLCYARSGDKGDISNVALLAFNEENYKIIKEQITSEVVKSHMKDVVKGDVKIYDVSNLNALNIVMYNALGGGATKTLRFDQTGKSMCNALLRMEVEV
jgi:primase-polymerase (primpol)-like protein